ncbi:MAG: polysulfide reductase NrfD, partial [Deltaproteobacteria bacterium]|nr:polysulfide reductase NrfD [Deltaproteobacteria bacterium]
LLSAIAVGYPMVVFESLAAARALRREPEMEVLTPLARFMPVLIGIYLAFKLADMFARGTYTYLLDGTLQSNAFLAEMVLGLILPFVLFLIKRVRESAGWLFFASTLYVLGVALNRVNVFIIGFTPPYMVARYFPAIGELAVTIGLIAAFLFFYKLFVVVFPVLSRTRGQATVTTLLLAVGLVTFCAKGVGMCLKGKSWHCHRGKLPPR